MLEEEYDSGILPSMHSPGLNSPWHRPGMVVPGCNASTSEAEQKFKVILNYVGMQARPRLEGDIKPLFPLSQSLGLCTCEVFPLPQSAEALW